MHSDVLPSSHLHTPLNPNRGRRAFFIGPRSVRWPTGDIRDADPYFFGPSTVLFTG
jgi:hypothetical protein